ncbi:MAG: cobyrinate a,c-diamide synthase [Burkholderiales bacterium]|nr:cobyrinate a,c-diamide synthase [Burkholderiales bacterium]
MSHSPRLLISAAHKSSGKTTLSIGLCRALRNRGVDVQPFKKGPDYIDPMWLSAAAGKACRNLDFNVMAPSEISAYFERHAADADVALIEGNKGLYDGLDLDGGNSNAALATLLGAPVMLVIDARGMTRGIAPLILGFQSFDQNIDIAGVILNNLGGARHEAKLRAVIEHYTNVPVIGAVHHDARIEIIERHLGLMPNNESTEAAEKIAAISGAIAMQVDLDRVLEISGWQPPKLRHISMAGAAGEKPVRAADVRIGWARDRAFGFYYADDLEALQQAGALLVPLDTLRDSRLPELDGLFIGGGFPERFMLELEANAALRADIRDEVQNGLPVYAECGGLMYLARSISWNGVTRQMTGAIPADVVMHDKPVGRGYVRLRETDCHPWPQQAATGSELPAHEFHYSTLENIGAGITFGYEVLRGQGIDGRRDGIVCHNVFACYAHLRSVGAHNWAERFVTFVRHVRSGNRQTDTAAATCGRAAIC